MYKMLMFLNFAVMFSMGMTTGIAAAPDAQVVEYERRLEEWKRADTAHQALSDAYWRAMRAARARGEYVRTHPPRYAGPAKPVHPTKVDPVTVSTIPKKEVFLQAIRDVYGFIPGEATEQEFKKNYAREALKAGLVPEHVVKVYAFETGGNGAYDLQPMGKNGPISTALGYAQLLNANSVIILAQHGQRFARELDEAGKTVKAGVVRQMARDASRVSGGWAAFQTFTKTPSGRAMHAMNLDIDVGPKMQMQKLRDIVHAARRGGHEALTPAQLELLNLAGEENGLLMLRSELAEYPTANFFARDGYEANPVVHERTAAQLLARIDELMTRWVLRPGAQEFRAAFDALQN